MRAADLRRKHERTNQRARKYRELLSAGFSFVSQARESRDVISSQSKGNFYAAGGSAEMPRDVEPRGFYIILAVRAAGSVRWERVMPFAAKT